MDPKFLKCQKIIQTTASWGSISSTWSTEYAKTGFARFWAVYEKTDIFGEEKHTISLIISNAGNLPYESSTENYHTPINSTSFVDYQNYV